MADMQSLISRLGSDEPGTRELDRTIHEWLGYETGVRFGDPEYTTGPEWDLSPIVAELPEGWKIGALLVEEGSVSIGVTNGEQFVTRSASSPKAAACIAMLRAHVEAAEE